MTDNCPICSSNSTIKPVGNGFSRESEISCLRCGEFICSNDNFQLTGSQIANISGWIRENQREKILSTDTEKLKNIKTPTVAEKANKLLLHLSKKYPTPGQKLDFPRTQDLHLLAISWSQNWEEFNYLYADYLRQEKGFILFCEPKHFKIAPKGWAYIDSLNRINPESQIAFVAMWFGDEVKSLWTEAIKPGIEDAGYNPQRIDKHQHNNRIDDEIIAMIRRSRFIVADFTGQRGGVYFEAGFALGLGLPVVWMCRKDEIDDKKVHFDTRQYNFVVWEEDKLEECKKALQHRIEATIGRGNYKPTTA